MSEQVTPLGVDVRALHPAAEWSDDCNGKQNYDGPVVSISTRYWPGWKSSDGRPSAVAAIVLNGARGDHYPIVEYEVSADTPGEVRAAVEAWVAGQYDALRDLLLTTVAGLPAGSST